MNIIKDFVSEILSSFDIIYRVHAIRLNDITFSFWVAFTHV